MDLKEIVKNTLELNLRYGSALINLSKDYVRAFGSVIKESDTPRTPTREPAPKRAPILLVGELGDTATGAFPLSNVSAGVLNVTLIVQGEVSADQVEVSPSSFALQPQENVFIRLKVVLTERFEENRDYFGALIAPGLSNQPIEFVVRRLAAKRTEPTGKDAEVA